MGPCLKDANCYGDICPGNICPGDICPNEQYLSCYWSDFDQIFWTHFFGCQDFCGPKFFLNPKFFSRPKILLWPKVFRPEILLDPNKFSNLNFFWTQKYFLRDQRNCLHPNCLDKKCVRFKKHFNILS